MSFGSLLVTLASLFPPLYSLLSLLSFARSLSPFFSSLSSSSSRDRSPLFSSPQKASPDSIIPEAFFSNADPS